MTLSTHIYVIDPVPVREVFTFCQHLLGSPENQEWEESDSSWRGDNARRIANKPGQGLDAWLMIHYGVDGPIKPDPGEACEDHDQPVAACDECYVPNTPEHAIDIDFDTAYSFQRDGMGCGALHALYVEAVGRWCEDRGVRYAWQNEFTGEIFSDWRVAAAELGAAGENARRWMEQIGRWMEQIVMPALTGGTR